MRNKLGNKMMAVVVDEADDEDHDGGKDDDTEQLRSTNKYKKPNQKQTSKQ